MWLAWLVRLRWVAVVAQVVTVSFTIVTLHQPVISLSVILACQFVLVLSNVDAMRRLRRPGRIEEPVLLSHLAIDVSTLTAVFAVTGGVTNPFLFIYLIHVAMGAVMLRPTAAMSLMAMVIVANGALHLAWFPLHPERHGLPPDVLLGLGQTIAFSVTVVSVGVFILGMASTLRRQKQRLYEARDRTARTDRLRAVGTLAAGAAHELNTPLATLDLRLRRIARRHTDDDTQADLRATRSQVARCKDVVEQLLVGAGDPSAAGIERACLTQLVQTTLDMWSKGTDQPYTLSAPDHDVPVALPRVAFSQALINLVQNAAEAQREVGVQTPIAIRVQQRGRRAFVEIEDSGPGLPTDDRIGEPFYTTKAQGTGLGVFVARAVADGAGGGLSYSRTRGKTTATWWCPTAGGTDDEQRPQAAGGR